MAIPKLQLLSRTQYDTDGTTTVWDFNFSGGYILPEHVKAYYDSAEGVRTPVSVVPDMLIGTWQLRISPPVPAGNVLTIYRATPKDQPLVDFADRGTVSEVALDTVARQAVFVAAEASDEVATFNGDVAANAAGIAVAAAATATAQAAASAASATAAATSAGAASSAAVAAVVAHKAELLQAGGSAAVGHTHNGGTTTTVQQAIRDIGFWVERFGAVGNGVTDCTTPVLNAIVAMRANPVSILDDIGGSMITAYSSGTLNFGPGVFVISADALAITQDLGLTLKGRGSRKTNNAVRAPTTLLVSGTSTGFGISVANSGARGFGIEDMDVCYASAGFTGNLIDTINAPGLTLTRVFLGTFGLTGATRLQTAKSLIRSTYDEYHTFNSVVFDGAVDGWWSDDLRSAGGNPFGGSVTKFNDCVFYDFTNRPIRHDGLRTRQGLHLSNTVVNPIQVNCQRAIDLTNVDGLTITGGGFAGSVANKALVEWVRLANCTGSVKGVFFDDLSKAGTLDGQLDVSGNRIYCTDGLTLKGGVITGKSNEVGKGTVGFSLEPAYPLSVDLGPDLFKNEVTNSYRVPADSLDLSGRINYAVNNDASTAKFSNTSSRVRVTNIDERLVVISSATHSISITETGRTIQAAGATSQTFGLPASVPGTRLTINKVSSVGLTVTCVGGNNFYRGVGGVSSIANVAAGDVGGTLVLEAYATIGWRVISQVGTWSFS